MIGVDRPAISPDIDTITPALIGEFMSVAHETECLKVTGGEPQMPMRRQWLHVVDL